MIRINGRNTIGKPDKLFGVSALAKARIAEIGKENVINSTLGVLLDDNGKLVVLSSVMAPTEVITKDSDIGGTGQVFR